jgi:hypothetical protein
LPDLKVSFCGSKIILTRPSIIMFLPSPTEATNQTLAKTCQKPPPK